MKIYVTGKFDDRTDIGQKLGILRSKGYHITHDWTQTGEQIWDDWPKMRTCSLANINGIKDADMVVGLMTDPGSPYARAFTEVGVALALNKTVILVCPSNRSVCYKNCYFHHPNIIWIKSWDSCVDTLEHCRTTNQHNVN